MRDRPGVIVYVTRAAPFEWELLLFDVVEEPGYEAIVPGGGIEEGETPEDAGVREVLEETGLEGADPSRPRDRRRDAFLPGDARRARR
ncbi:MAG: NUDIX domain-containing protein [Thermoleophilia bacterium]